MTDQSAEYYKNLLSIDPKIDQPFLDILAEKLRELLPEDIIKVSSRTNVSGLCSINIDGYLFSEKAKRKSQHTIVTIIVLDDLDETTLRIAYKDAATINVHDDRNSYPTIVGSDLGGISVFILARTASISLEDIGVAVVRLNLDNQSETWPDAMGVCDKGLLSYTAFIPGQGQAGDFFLPRGRGPSQAAPSLSLQLTARASEKSAFAKVMSLITARCIVSLRDPRIPNYELLAPDFPSQGLAFATYQFDLDGQLKPQIFEQSLAAQMPGNRFLIESNGKTLGSIRFLQWQNGSVIAMNGKFPLEPFLLFLREVVESLVPEQLQLFRHGKTQLSYVLPVTSKDFLQALTIFAQRSSNITLRQDDEKHLVQKVSDEGLSSKFVSRLIYGILTLREGVFTEKEARDHFDRQYDDVYNGLQSVREARNKIIEAWSTHKQKFNSGEIISRDGNTIHIEGNIDRPIRRETENLWNAAVRLIKQMMQVLLRENGVETGFLFKKKATFQEGIATLRQTNVPLAYYIQKTRNWTEPLILLRNEKLEHGQPICLKVDYDINSDPPRIIQPSISGKPLTEYIEFIFDRCCSYVEEMTMHCIKQKLPPSLTITEIPKNSRAETAAVRFALTVSPGGAPEWTISYEETTFDNR